MPRRLPKSGLVPVRHKTLGVVKFVRLDRAQRYKPTDSWARVTKSSAASVDATASAEPAPASTTSKED